MNERKVISIALGLFIVLGLAVPLSAEASLVPLRAGTVVSASENGAWTLVQARDEGGKAFWVYIGVCAVGEGGKIEVLQGRRYDKLKSTFGGADKILKDAYVADLVRINGKDVRSISAHGMPEGCLLL